MKININTYIFRKRILDIILAATGIIFFFIPLSLICIIIKITSKGPIIHWSDRIGMNNLIFRMAKLRTMKIGTPIIASNLINSQDNQLICFGKFLRNTGIDELPQLYNILKGEMSFVGPRPVIIYEYDLINMRTKRGIDKIKPGLTGLAQVKGRGKLPVDCKIKFDELYLHKMSIAFDLKIIMLTNYWLLRENLPLKKYPDIKISGIPINKNFR